MFQQAQGYPELEKDCPASGYRIGESAVAGSEEDSEIVDVSRHVVEMWE